MTGVSLGEHAASTFPTNSPSAVRQGVSRSVMPARYTHMEGPVATSQNGFEVLLPSSPKLHTWTIPARNGEVRLTLRNGSAGFLLCHFLLWYSETIEDLTGSHPQDDWGYAYRAIRGQSSGFSNHASGTAADANATEHPLGVKGTLTPRERERIAARLRAYEGCLRHGAFYSGRVDEMHVEINASLADCERVARKLDDSKRGTRILDANPGQKAVILS